MIYKIAGIYVEMDPQYPRTAEQSMVYRVTEPAKPDLILRTDKKIMDKLKEIHSLPNDESSEYMLLATEFYEYLIEFGGFMLHSSAVVHNGKAYLFSAPSGTGKSTHTQLWVKHFDDAYIINDDKPAIRLINGKFYVYGTPFSGKTNLNVNACVPLGGICVLERGETNSIEKIPPEEAMFRILDQTVRPVEEDRMDTLLKILGTLISNESVYRLRCNTDEEACEVSYNGMKGEE